MVTSARPPATNRKMAATSTSGTADSAPLRHIQPSASSPSGDPGQRVGALARAWCRSTRSIASQSPITCTISRERQQREHRPRTTGAPRSACGRARTPATAISTAPIDPRPRRRRRHVHELAGRDARLAADAHAGSRQLSTTCRVPGSRCTSGGSALPMKCARWSCQRSGGAASTRGARPACADESRRLRRLAGDGGRPVEVRRRRARVLEHAAAARRGGTARRRSRAP